jgi:Tol biopolymer transport system component
MKNKVTTLNGTDQAPKFQFVWSNDGTKVYFIQGDKSDTIDSINISDGAITKVYSDSLTSKSDLRLSADGKKVLFSVGKEGTTSYTDADKTDVTGIDLTNTENQLYVVDLTASELKAVQLTSTTDNKVFPAFLMNGNIVYTSYDSDGVKLPVLNVIGADNVISPLVIDKDIVTTEVTATGKVLIVANEKNGYQTIYEVNTTSKKLTKLAQTKLQISSMSVSIDGKSMAITVPGENGDHVMVLKNGQFEEITK